MLQEIIFHHKEMCKREFIPSIIPSLHPKQITVYLHILYLKVICNEEDVI